MDQTAKDVARARRDDAKVLYQERLRCVLEAEKKLKRDEKEEKRRERDAKKAEKKRKRKEAKADNSPLSREEKAVEFWGAQPSLHGQVSPASYLWFYHGVTTAGNAPGYVPGYVRGGTDDITERRAD